MSKLINENVSAVIVAAGAGKRFGKDIKKQFIKINGHSVLEWTLSAFNKAHFVQEIILVCQNEDVNFINNEILSGISLKIPVKLILGGRKRSDSVKNGILAVSKSSDTVAIHDAARPLIDPQMIDQLCKTAFKFNAVVPAVKATDSTFIGKNEVVQDYLNRDELWCAQTPQIFNRSKILDAHAKADNDNFTASDDAVIYKKYIGDVRIFESSSDNIKITYPTDIVFAENYLSDKIFE